MDIKTASNMAPYLVAGLSIVGGSIYLLSRYRVTAIGKKPAPSINQEVHDSLRRGRQANERESSHQKLTLPDGRTLGYATYGSTSPNAPTIIFIHGAGDNRLSGGFFASSAEDLGIRLISIDRPGWGLSSTRLGGTVLDFAKDLQYLAEKLDVQQYGVMGASGGGPFTLACAYALPKEQLKSVTMLVASGPWNSTTMKHATWFPWLFWTVVNNSTVVRRWAARSAFKKYQSMDHTEYVSSSRKQMEGWLVHLLNKPHEKDLALFQDDEFFAFSFDLLKGNFDRADGVEGMVEDWRVMTTEDLGFQLQDIRHELPVQLWYGKYDTSVSWRVGEDLKKRLSGDRVELHVRDETHLSMLLSYRSELLEKAVETVRK